MKKRLGREMVWLMLPVLFVGAFGWWRSRTPLEEKPPEDVRNGRRRALVGKWQELEPSAFDVYRGYQRKFEVSLWSAGQLPPIIPTKGARSLGVERRISIGYPTPDVAYKHNGKWQKLAFAPENPAVLIEFPPNSERIGERMVVPLLVRLPPTAPPDEVMLQGRFNLRVWDLEDYQLNSVSTSQDLLNEHDLLSPPINHLISAAGRKRLSQLILRVAPLRLKSLEFRQYIFQQISLDIKAECDASFPLNAPYTVRLHRGRLLDVKGQEVAKCVSYGHDVQDNLVTFSPSFQITPNPKQKVPDVLIFQGALSVNGSWPLEINRIIPRKKGESAKLSPIHFQR